MNNLKHSFPDRLKKLFSKLSQPVRWYWHLATGKKLLVAGLVFAGSILTGILILVGFYSAVASGMYGKIPTDEDLINIKNFEASEVYSADSVLLGRYFVENRSDVKYDEISPNIINALIATEDVRFYEHEGVDHQSLMRVLFKSIILGQHKGGGSTITQQLVKNLFGREQHGMLTMPVNKTREAIIANQLERLYTKEEILTLYLNTVSFGEDTYGIRVACERYFSTTPKVINQESAAVLVGMLKAPSAFNPRLHSEAALNRRNVVLGQMLKYGYLDQQQCDSLKALPVALDYQKMNLQEGSAAYLRERIRIETEAWLKKENPSYNLYTDGLRIYTTINARMQQYAEEAVAEHLSALQPVLYGELKNAGMLKSGNPVFDKLLENTPVYAKLSASGKSKAAILENLKTEKATRLFTYSGEVDTIISSLDSLKHMLSVLQAGFLVTDPKNGDVLAWVGGAAYTHFQYDHVTSKRQVGSVFKPIVYARALLDGKKPCDYVLNQKITYAEYDDWAPTNSGAEEKPEGRYSLVGALTNSVNNISVRLCMESGIDNVLALADSLGIKDSLPRVPSIALGVADLSLFDLLHVYTAFANEGNSAKLQYVKSVQTKEGKELYNDYKTKNKAVLKQEVAADITNMLRSVVDAGTAARLRSRYNFKGDIAGKTGTTQNQTDGWFVGYTPQFLAGVWVGADDPAIHFQTIKNGQGANAALPVWALFYRKLLQDPLLSGWVEGEFPHKEDFDCPHYKELSGIEKLFIRKERTEKRKGYEEKKPFLKRLFEGKGE